MPDMHLCIYKVLLGMKKTILVTGSTGVIGLSISQFFYKKGFNVIINGKCKPSQLRDVKKNLTIMIINLFFENVVIIINLRIKFFKNRYQSS